MKGRKIFFLLPRAWLSLPVSISDGLRVHHFEFLLQARFVYFLLFEFLLQRSDVVERDHAVAVNILLARVSEVIVIFLPKQFLLFSLLELLPGLLQVVDKDSALIDQYVNDLPQLSGIGISEIGKKCLAFDLLLPHLLLLKQLTNQIKQTGKRSGRHRWQGGRCVLLFNQINIEIILICLQLLNMERQEEETLTTPGVIEKYQISAKIVNDVLGKLLKKISVGSKIFDLCLWSDGQIYQELSKVYNKKPVFKGLAFPTTISVNEVCAYNAPLQEDSTTIKEGDLVKVQLGAHIDGFPAFVAHTLVIQSDKNAPITGKKADVILAAYKAAHAALRLLKPGHLNNEVTQVIQKVCDSYQVNPVEGVLSHELKKHLIDGNKVIINKETFDQRVDPQEFAVHDVFALDVLVSSGEGKPKESDIRCTVYKRALDRSYNLKIKQSRQFFNDVLDRYPSFCFSLNSFEDPITARIGIKQCLEHELLVPFPILVEKPGNLVAQFKFTVMITKGKTTALTGLAVDEAQFKTENSIKDQYVLDLLALSMDKAEQKKEKKKQELKA